MDWYSYMLDDGIDDDEVDDDEEEEDDEDDVVEELKAGKEFADSRAKIPTLWSSFAIGFPLISIAKSSDKVSSDSGDGVFALALADCAVIMVETASELFSKNINPRPPEGADDV